MLQLDILGGRASGSPVVIRRFPFTLGRAEACDLRLPEPGVWERHARFTCSPSEGFFIEAIEGLISVDGQGAQRSRLQSGALVEIGPVTMRCGLSPARQRRFLAGEAAVWLALLGLVLLQVLAIWLWLP